MFIVDLKYRSLDFMLLKILQNHPKLIGKAFRQYFIYFKIFTLFFMKPINIYIFYHIHHEFCQFLKANLY